MNHTPKTLHAKHKLTQPQATKLFHYTQIRWCIMCMLCTIRTARRRRAQSVRTKKNIKKSHSVLQQETTSQ